VSDLQIRVFGSDDITAERVTEIGQAYADLLDAVSEGMGHGKVGLRVVGVQWCCDGCDIHALADRKPSDWLNVGGNDYCSRCQRERGL
jgi:hypothetical protein